MATFPQRPRIVLGADSLRPMASGVGRVARLMARVIAEERDAGALDATAIVLRHGAEAGDIRLAATEARGSRVRFAIATHRAAVKATHFAYDFSGIARAHCRLPGLRRPYLTWIHGIEMWEEARATRLQRAREADLLLANSRFTLERAAALHPGLDRARVCWLGTETDDEPEPRTADAPPVVLLLGRIDAGGGYKGHREIIDCWPVVADAVPRARLVIAGSGPGLAVVRDLARRSNAGASIEMSGFVPERAIDSLWRRATVFAMPSRGEGFGLVYVEAMRHGVPVVASVHDAAAEIVIDGETGYLVDLGSPGALAERLVTLLRDRALGVAFGENGRRRWREHFRYGAFRDRFRPLLHAFLGVTRA